MYKTIGKLKASPSEMEPITIYNDPDWAKPEVITHEGHQYVLKFVSCSKKLCNDEAWRMNRGLGPWPEMKGRNTIIHELSNWKENYGVYVYVGRLGEVK
jgi:hypothetical protein